MMLIFHDIMWNRSFSNIKDPSVWSKQHFSLGLTLFHFQLWLDLVFKLLTLHERCWGWQPWKGAIHIQSLFLTTDGSVKELPWTDMGKCYFGVLCIIFKIFISSQFPLALQGISLIGVIIVGWHLGGIKEGLFQRSKKCCGSATKMVIIHINQIDQTTVCLNHWTIIKWWGWWAYYHIMSNYLALISKQRRYFKGKISKEISQQNLVVMSLV